MLDNASKLCVKIEVFKAEMDFEKLRVHSQLRHIKANRRKIICNLLLKGNQTKITYRLIGL